MFRRKCSRAEFEQRRIERQTKVYTDLMTRPYCRRMAEKSRGKTLEHRVASVAIWAMLSGAAMLALLFAAGLEGFGFDLLFLVTGVLGVLCVVRFSMESTVLAIDLRALEQGAKAGTVARADVGNSVTA